MIQPVNALTPKVFFKGELGDSDASYGERIEKNIALVNAAGISIAIGAAMTAASRSYTSSWKHAGWLGFGTALVSMMFLGPSLFYRAANLNKKPTTIDTFVKDNKLIDSKKSFSSKIGSYSKSLIKKTA